MIPVTRRFPQIHIKNIWRDNFRVATLSILTFYKLDQSIVNVSSSGLKETRPRTEFVEEEQFLILKKKKKISTKMRS